MGDDFKNGNRLMEKEKSDRFNADLERLRSGRGPDIRRDGKQIEARRSLFEFQQGWGKCFLTVTRPRKR
jgi:hypothetical protein